MMLLCLQVAPILQGLQVASIYSRGAAVQSANASVGGVNTPPSTPSSPTMHGKYADVTSARTVAYAIQLLVFSSQGRTCVCRALLRTGQARKGDSTKPKSDASADMMEGSLTLCSMCASAEGMTMLQGL